MFVCLCEAVSDTVIRDAIRSGAQTVEAVGRACKAGTSCGKCRTTIEWMIVREMQRDALVTGPSGRTSEESGT
ncbi:MAG: hypothetical protein AMXMBFR46_19980 [Acidimicrobiia bacterium]